MTHSYDPRQPLPPGRAVFGVDGPPGDHDALRHAREWLGHLEAGRIGRRIPATPEQLARHAHNGSILLGK